MEPPEATRQLRKASYSAWVIVGVCFLARALMAGMNTSFGVFLVPLSRQFGWSAGAISFLSGSYQPAWMLSLVAGIVTAFVALGLAPPVHPGQRHQRPEEVGAPASIATSSSPA